MGRNGEAVAKWVYEIAKRTDAEFEYVDIKDYKLPLLDEPVPPSLGQYLKDHTKAWAAKINSFDAFVFVTAEYNHGIPGALKNAIDQLTVCQILRPDYCFIEPIGHYKNKEKKVEGLDDTLL